jgi:hypothetical protein
MSENNSLKYTHVGTRFEALSSMNLAVIIDCELDRWLAIKEHCLSMKVAQYLVLENVL